MPTCNSPYFYAMSVIGQVVWVARVVTHYIYGATQFNLLQLHYNYNHNIILMLLIFTHPLEFDTQHYEDLIKFFWSIDFHRLLWLLMTVQNYNTWHNTNIYTNIYS